MLLPKPIGILLAAFYAAQNSIAVQATNSSPPDYEYKFPTTVATKQDRMPHGLCVMGATSATVTSNSDIKYESVPDFKDGTYLWGEMFRYSWNIDGRGDAKCEGGLYLRPSSNKGPPPGTDIVLEVAAENVAEGVTICAFVGPSKHDGFDQDGGWHESLPAEGFTESATFGVILNNGGSSPGGMASYCKKLTPASDSSSTPTFAATSPPSSASPVAGNPTSSPTSDTTSILSSRSTCPDDIELKHIAGTTAFPSGLQDSIAAVEIIAQRTTTVDVQLRQAWNGPVESYFYMFRNSEFGTTCYEDDNLLPDESIDTITLYCNILSPKALLYICLQDTKGAVLTQDDKGTVPKCCHSVLPDDTPTVCYSVEISCVTECGTGDESPTRYLRGLSV